MDGKRLKPIGNIQRMPDAVCCEHESGDILEGTLAAHLSHPARRSAARFELSFGVRRWQTVQFLDRHAGRPNRRSRATPPSGKILKRTCDARSTAERASNVC